METWTSEQCSKRLFKTPWNPEWFGSKNNKHVFFLSYFPIYLHLTDRTKTHNYPRTMSYPREKKHPQTTSPPPNFQQFSHLMGVGLRVIGSTRYISSVRSTPLFRSGGTTATGTHPPSGMITYSIPIVGKGKGNLNAIWFNNYRLWIMHLSILELISKQMLSMRF